MIKIAIILGSVVKNKELALKIEEVVNELGQSSQMINLVELNLPLYSSLVEDNDGIPIKAKELTQLLLKFDAFIIVSPEYNGSMPPVLTNAITWVSREGDDFRAIFNQKFIALASHSGGGGMRGNDAMRGMFSYLGANVLTREIITNHSKPYKKSTAESIIKELIAYI